MELYDYQNQIIQEIAESYRQGKKRPLVVLPTGGGKTVIFCELISRSVAKMGGFVSVLVHRQELAEQTVKTLSKMGVSSAMVTAKGTEELSESGEFIVSHKQVKRGFSAFVVMVETLHSRRARETYKALIESPNFIIVDEFHFTNFVKVLNEINENTPVFGFTATPLYSNKKHKISKYHDRLIIGATPGELIARGRLVAPVYYIHKIDEINLKKRGGEFTDESIVKTYTEESILESVLANYNEHQRGEKTLLFTSSIAYAEVVRNYLLENGINARSIDSKSATKEERVEVFKWLREEEDAFLVNVGIATTGTDIPDLKSIILLRATTSLTLYIQMTGRGARTSPGKDHFKVFDYGNNRERLGFWEEARDWDALIKAAEKPKRKRKADDLGLEVITIPGLKDESGKETGVVILQPDGSLPPDYQYLYTKPVGEMDFGELQLFRKVKNYKPGWIYRQIWDKHGERGLSEYAQLKNYSSGWAWQISQRFLGR